MDDEKLSPVAHGVTRNKLLSLVHAGLLSPDAFQSALVRHEPRPDAWRLFIERALLVLGGVLMASGVMFFFAYNWQEMGYFLKLGLIQLLILGLVIFVYYRGLDNLTGKISLAAASFMVGVLIAVYGQIYQTGADSYQLFLTWSLLILGWCFIARFDALWGMLWVLVNLGLWFFWSEIGYFDYPVYLGAYLLVLVNGIALIIYERIYSQGLDWLRGRWLPRLISLPVVVVVMGLTWMWLAEAYYESVGNWELLFKLTPVIYILVVGLVLYVYYFLRHDLFILAAASFSVIGVVMAAVIRYTSDTIGSNELGIVFLWGILLIVMTGYVVSWLRKTAAAWGGEE